MSNDQAAEILADLNANNVEYEAPINQVEKFKMDSQAAILFASGW